ncbi:hypothetical protein [Methylococcus sp. EFPC2]|uniref:hypothetical protein n=1 Tax=Methylococcus sp. EFPC2 TaxID=2812648 RepID=UPI0019680C13|nr:hypothetical protein [Methylococcus sp. EFPC2]QSA96365.1 hypothetical protein JWZ97_14230 [Methylococcus sp. EFPC2]
MGTASAAGPPLTNHAGQRLSVYCKNQTLSHCLELTGAGLNLRFRIDAAQIGQDKITVAFADLSLAAALARLLEGYSYVSYPYPEGR